MRVTSLPHAAVLAVALQCPSREHGQAHAPHMKTEINNHNIWIKYPPSKLFAFKTSVERSINYETRASFVCVGGALCVGESVRRS